MSRPCRHVVQFIDACPSVSREPERLGFDIEYIDNNDASTADATCCVYSRGIKANSKLKAISTKLHVNTSLCRSNPGNAQRDSEPSSHLRISVSFITRPSTSKRQPSSWAHRLLTAVPPSSWARAVASQPTTILSSFVHAHHPALNSLWCFPSTTLFASKPGRSPGKDRSHLP